MRKAFAVPVICTGAALLFYLLPTPAAPAEEKVVAPKTAVVRVGLVKTLFRDEADKQVQSLAEPFKSLLEEAGIKGELVSGGDYVNLATQLKEGKNQIGVFNGFEFAWARSKDPELKPLLIAANQKPFIRAVLVVRQDYKAADPTALQGKIIALPVLARDHCRLFLESRCVGKDSTKEKWFAKVAAPRTAQDALDDLAENYTQGAVVDDVDWAAFGKSFPKTAAKLRVLVESDKFPCGIIAYRQGGLDDDTINTFRSGMIEANNTAHGRKLLDLCRITAFQAVPEDFEKSLTDILKAYPPPAAK